MLYLCRWYLPVACGDGQRGENGTVREELGYSEQGTGFRV